jgi:putative ABC transport system permease protein
MIPLRYNLRSLLVRKTSNLLALVGVALVVFVLAAALMLSAGIKKTLGVSARADAALVLRKGAEAELSSSIDDPLVSLVSAQPGIKSVDGAPCAVAESVVVVAVKKIGVEGVTNIQIRGVTPRSNLLRPELHVIEGRAPHPGSEEVMIGRSLVGRFEGMRLGQQLEIKKNRKVSVVGVFAAGGSSYESEVWIDHESLRAAFGRQGSVSSVRLLLDSPSTLAGIRTSIEQDKRLGLEVISEAKYFERISEGTSLFISTMGSVIAVFFALGAMIGAMITMYGSVAHRQREIGTLRALGFKRRHILLAFLIESALLCLTGGVLGCVAAMAMGFVEISMMNFSSWSEVVFRFDPNPQTIITSLVFALLMGTLGGFLPAVRASRVSPAVAMRG